MIIDNFTKNYFKTIINIEKITKLDFPEFI